MAGKDLKLEQFLSHEERDRNQLTTTVTLSPADFERLYLSPKQAVTGNLRTTFANPTPIALMGFSVGLLPLSIAFMGWGGAGGSAVATTTCSIWFGGLLLIMAGIGEFIMGNTFPMMIFMGYGAHFLASSTVFIPSFNAIGFFAPSSEGTIAQGSANPEFAASYGFYFIAMMLLSFIYLIGSLRTNVCFVFIFVLATVGFGFAAGAYFAIASGSANFSGHLRVGAGACFFADAALGWYLLLAVMITTMELPVPDLPIGDLSSFVKARPRGVKVVKDE